MTRISQSVLSFADSKRARTPDRPAHETADAAEYLQHLLTLADRLLNGDEREAKPDARERREPQPA